MPRRLTPLVNNEFYHLFNRGVNKQEIFTIKSDYKRAKIYLELYKYNYDKHLRYSKLRVLPNDEIMRRFTAMKNSPRSVDIISYCLMPNHFHLLLRQNTDNGISRFLSNFQNSYARFYNTKYKRIGPLWQGAFKAVHIGSDRQLLHVSRYIHLNPYSSALVKGIETLLDYQWSSFPEYVFPSGDFCEKEIILNQYKREKYKNFVLDRRDYQRSLEYIKKHLID